MARADFLDGYDKFCSTAKKLSSLLFELQRDHLQQFLLTWTILNKRMYQRYVYLEFQQYIPDCILKLKQSMQPDDCSAMAHRLIRFDEDMTSIAKSWCDIWSLIQDYHVSEPDVLRRNRLGCVQEMLRRMRDCKFDAVPSDKMAKPDKASKMQWTKLECRDDAWIAAINYLKYNWEQKDDDRLRALVRMDNCNSCLSIAKHLP